MRRGNGAKSYSVTFQPERPNAILLGTHARVSIRFVSERISRYPPTAAKPDPRPFIRSRDPRVSEKDTLHALLRPGTSI